MCSNIIALIIDDTLYPVFLDLLDRYFFTASEAEKHIWHFILFIPPYFE